jgi:hypothetical protein
MLIVDAGIGTRSSPTSPVGLGRKDDRSRARPVTDSSGSLVRHWIGSSLPAPYTWIQHRPTDT